MRGTGERVNQFRSEASGVTGKDITAGAIAPHEADRRGERKASLLDAPTSLEQDAVHAMKEPDPSSLGAPITLRVAEARVEDVGHAIARLAPTDLVRIGARAGDVLKITGGTVSVGRAELSDDAHDGMIQMGGQSRSN